MSARTERADVHENAEVQSNRVLHLRLSMRHPCPHGQVYMREGQREERLRPYEQGPGLLDSRAPLGHRSDVKKKRNLTAKTQPVDAAHQRLSTGCEVRWTA